MFREGLLHDRAAGRTFEWGAPFLLHVPGLVVQSGIAPVEGTHGLNEHIIFSRGSQYAVVNPTMEAVAWFELDDPAGSGSQWWAYPNGDHLLLRANHGVYSIDLWEGGWRKIEFPPVGNVHIQILDGGQGFILSFSSRDWNNCRIAAYSWAGRILSNVLVPCIPLGSSPIDISPDGRFVATLTRVVPEVHGGRMAGTGDYNYYSNLMVTSLFDATTGEELLRAKGVAPFRGRFDRSHHEGNSWLADSSGIVVKTPDSTRVLGVDGSWASLFPLGLILPAPDDPTHFDRPSHVGTFGHDDCFRVLEESKSQRGWCFLPTATVVGSDGQVIAALRGTLQPGWAGAGAFTCCNRTSWGLTGGELRLHLDESGAWRGFEQPVLSPQIELPPFEDRLLLQVATSGPCLHLREAPYTESASLNCLPAGSLVEVAPPPDYREDQDHPWWFQGLSVERSNSGCATDAEGHHDCYWIHVRTDEWLEGWMLSDFLRWAP